MNRESRSTRDPFTFSLGGLSAKSSFVLTPAIADDRIRKACVERPGGLKEDQPDTDTETKFVWGRFWLRALRRAA